MSEISQVVPTLQSIAVEKIQPSRHQARKLFADEALKGLAESMKQEGLIEPIVIRQTETGYELISGERRLRAAKMLGWETIESKVIQTVSEAQASAKGLIENLLREDLNPIEEAEGFKELLDLNDSHWSQDGIAKVLGKDKAYVSRSLALLSLPDSVKDELRRRNLEKNHGIELLRINNSNSQKGMANKIIKGGWSVKKTRHEIDILLGVIKTKAPTSNPYLNPSVVDPLAAEWGPIKANMNMDPSIHWEVSYGPHKLASGDLSTGWFFFVLPVLTSSDANSRKAAVAQWFKQMAQALAGESVAPVVPESAGQIQEAEQTVMDAFKPRLPEGADQEKELERIAIQEGPQAVYSKLYGAESPLVQAAPKTWQDVGIEDPIQGLRQILEGIQKMR